jgi:hypothetical protein
MVNKKLVVSGKSASIYGKVCIYVCEGLVMQLHITRNGPTPLVNACAFPLTFLGGFGNSTVGLIITF